MIRASPSMATWVAGDASHKFPGFVIAGERMSSAAMSMSPASGAGWRKAMSETSWKSFSVKGSPVCSGREPPTFRERDDFRHGDDLLDASPAFDDGLAGG